MKALLFVVTAALLGGLFGLATTYIEFSTAREQFQPTNEVVPKLVAEKGKRDPNRKYPKVTVVGDTEYDFGTMERSSILQHAFVFRNDGDAPLTLEMGRVTCRCTISHLEGDRVQPGKSAEVTLEWNARNTGTSPAFEVAAEIHTNDPDQPVVRLVVRGLVTSNLRTFPDVVTLGKVAVNGDATTQFRIFNYVSDELRLESVTFLNPDTASLFSAQSEPVSAEDLKRERGARCGLLVTVHIQSGLPTGPINQTIRLVTNLGADAILQVPFEGTVVSDILLGGGGNFDSQRSLLDFGAIRKGDTAAADVGVFVKGSYRKDIKVSVGRVEPDGSLRATIGPPEELANGRIVKYVVHVEVPADAHPVTRLGGESSVGEIMLETTHPQAKEVPIYVRFAVQD